MYSNQKARNNYWLNRTQNRAPRETMTSSIPKTDYLKVMVLFSLFAVCFYSAVQKFFLSGGAPSFSLEPSFTICDKYAPGGDKADEKLLDGCKGVVTMAYGSAQQLCKGFIQ